MLIAGAFIAIILAASAALGQVQSPPTAQPSLKPDQLCTAEGTLVNSVTGEPVKKVEVVLSAFGGRGQTPQHTALSDSNGHFVFQDVEPGRYSMQAGGGGFPYQIYGQQSSGRRWEVISLEPGQHEKDLVFKIAPGAVISGTVYDEDGDPVVNARVEAIQAGHTGRGSAGGARTNDRGEYRIFGLEAGKYMLLAETPKRVDAEDNVALPTYYPGTTDPAQASPVQVHAGDEMSSINLMVVMAHGVRVQGRVVNAPKTQVQRTYVQLIARGNERGFANRNYGAPVKDENGDFEINGVPPGSYVALAGWDDEKAHMMGRATLEVSNVNVDNLTLLLKPSFDLRGRVRTESGAQLDFSRLRIWLQPSENRMAGGAGGEVKADGSFVVRNVYDGSYRLHVAGFPEQFYLKTARLGGMDSLAAGLTITNADASTLIEVELTATGGTISGTVMHNQKPVPGALVVLVPDPPNRTRPDLFENKVADAFGRFTLLGLPPGNFKIFAWDSALDVNAQDPDFLKNYEDRGTPVEVESKRSQSIQLESISLEEPPQ